MLNGWGCRGNRPEIHVGSSVIGTQPLSDAQTGRRLKVTSIAGGRHLCARMASMGIYPGAEMELVCAGCGSPCLVRIHGGTISLGAGVSQKILVTSII